MDEHKSRFEKLIKIVTSYPILRQPDMSRQLILHTDASNQAMGAVLRQVDDNNNEYVIAYASKSFRIYEKHMHFK